MSAPDYTPGLEPAVMREDSLVRAAVEWHFELGEHAGETTYRVALNRLNYALDATIGKVPTK